VAVLLSGSGSTLENLIHHIQAGCLSINISLVISSRQDVYGLQCAKKHNIKTSVVPRDRYGPEDHQGFSQSINKMLYDHHIDLVVLAGFMHLFLPEGKYKNRAMNIHPSLIPAFCGKGFYGHHVHEAVINSGVKVTGVTIHFIDDQYDHGPIILQEAIHVDENDTSESLKDRVQKLERELYPIAIRLFSEGCLEVIENKVHVRR